MSAVPVAIPKHGLDRLLLTVPVIGTSGRKFVVGVYTQEGPTSKSVTVYVPGKRLFAVFPVCKVGVHVYENGPMPPLACTVADPKLAQVIENVVKEWVGVGLIEMLDSAETEQPFILVPITV